MGTASKKSRILDLLAREPGISFSEIGRRVGASGRFVGQLANMLGLRRDVKRGDGTRYDASPNAMTIGFPPGMEKWIYEEAERLQVAPSTIVRICVARSMP